MRLRRRIWNCEMKTIQFAIVNGSASLTTSPQSAMLVRLKGVPVRPPIDEHGRSGGGNPDLVAVGIEPATTSCGFEVLLANSRT